MIGLALLLASTLTLKEAETIAMKANPAIQLAEQDVKQRDYQKLQSILSWLPDITFGSMYAKLQKSQKISSSQRQTHLFSNQFTLTQPIFSPSLLGDLKLSNLAYEGSMAASEMTINDTLFQVRTLYLTTTLKQKKLQVERRVIAYLNGVYEDEKKKQQLGSGTGLQVNRSKAALTQEITAYYNALKEESDSKQQLSLMLHMDPAAANQLVFENTLRLDDYPLLVEKLALLKQSINADIAHPSNLDKPFTLFSEQEIQQWVMLARQHRPELRRSQLFVQAAQEKSRQSKTQYLPTISAFADYGYYQPINGQFFRQRNDFAGGVQLSWSLFDSFKREAKVLEIAALKKAAAVAYQYDNDKVEVTIRNDLHQIEEALFTYLSATDNLQLASQILEETRVQLTSGTIKELDLQNAQKLFAEAELQNSQAEFTLLETYFQLRYDTALDIPEK